MRPRKIILLVEDNDQVRSTTKFLLETRGYRVFEVGNSDDALVLFEQPVDLVLCDLVLDHEDGNVLCHRMKGLRPETPIVLYSATTQNLDRVTAADSFLSKGSNSPVELLERVRLMVGRKRGPRKGWRRCQPPVAPAADEVATPPEQKSSEPRNTGAAMKRRIFVFGSNLAGSHGAGAARHAAHRYGAVWGVGEGLTGDSYALPTMDWLIRPRSLDGLQRSVRTFLTFASSNPDLTFHVTRVGCGIAGFTDDQIAPLFKDAPANSEFSPEWAQMFGYQQWKEEM